MDLNSGLTSAEGIHAAAMGGIWQCIVLGFAGVSVKDGRLSDRAPSAEILAERFIFVRLERRKDGTDGGS